MRKKPTIRPVNERFFEKVDTEVSGQFWGGTRCHEWTATTMPNGYGQVRVNTKAVYAHRLAWQLANGPIPDGMYVLHACDNRKCVNPGHLFLGSFQDNMDDMVNKRRHAYGARNGHAKLSEEQARAIRHCGGKQEDVAAAYGISRTIVSQIRSGKIWRYL